MTAAASSSVTRGLACARSASSCVRVMGMRWIWNASAPISDTIAFDTAPFNPWISDTTAMIDVTATMLPSTVSSDRSLFDQIALRAMPMASMNLFM